VTTSGAIQVGQLTVNYLLEGTAVATMEVFEPTVLLGAHVPPPHSHSANDESVYVLEGTFRYAHFSDRGSETARVTSVLTPDIGAQYFREIGELVHL
jgi:hypothetical protein